MTTTEKIIKKYLSFSGERSFLEFAEFNTEVTGEIRNHNTGSRDFVCLNYIHRKLMKGMSFCIQNGGWIDVIIEDSVEDIERGYDTASKEQKKSKKKKGEDLGKIVDYGKVSPRGNSDIYWRNKGIDLVFLPDDKKVRVGEKIPETYKYTDMRFLETFYGLRAFEFGNWLSQQDRLNYVSGLGLALYDLHKLLGIKPEKLSIKNKLAVAFGARGRGRALAHFEPGSFVINLTRYSRPPNEDSRSENFKRANLILNDGGVGAFAHEYGHALDYFGGLNIDRGDHFTLSRDDSTDPKPDMTLLKKSTLKGLMEKLLYKIIWSTPNKHTPYYARLTKGKTRKYFKQRNEIFARAFEVYVQYKLESKKHKNIFLNRSKYPTRYYMTTKEMKRVINEFDTLINAIKKHL